MMSIEENIERIAVASEAIAELLTIRASGVEPKAISPVAKTDNVVDLHHPTVTGSQSHGVEDEGTGEITASRVDLDADGTPWDARIHGVARKKLVKEGTWKLKKGVDKTVVETVLTELRAVMAAPPPPATDTLPPPPATDTLPPPPATDTLPPSGVAEITYLVGGHEYGAEQLRANGWSETDIAGAEQVQVETAPTAVEPMKFPDLMRKITPAKTAGTLTDDIVTAACVKHGLPSLMLLASRPDLIPVIHTELFAQ